MLQLIDNIGLRIKIMVVVPSRHSGIQTTWMNLKQSIGDFDARGCHDLVKCGGFATATGL